MRFAFDAGSRPADATETSRLSGELGLSLVQRLPDFVGGAAIAEVLAGGSAWRLATVAQGGSFHPGQRTADADRASTQMTDAFTLGFQPSFNGGG